MDLSKLATEEGIEEERDSIGGFTALESDAYLMKIKLAFITLSAGKAMAMNVHFDGPDKTSLRAQFWMTSGEAKGCKNFYINKKTGAKHYLPGFNQANALCLLTGSGPVTAQKTEKKTINLYDGAAGKEVPTEVDMVMGLLGKEILAGVLNQTVDKTAKDPATGAYLPTGESRVENEVDKLFRVKDSLTVMEIKAKATEPVFLQKWLDKWKGVVKDKTSKDTGTAGAPKRETGKQAPQESLFA